MATKLSRRILLRSTTTLPSCNFSYAESIIHRIELARPSNGLTRSNHDKRTLITTASRIHAFSSEKYARTRLISSASTKVIGLLDNNNVVVFSKSYCPFCVQTKELFKKMNVEFAVHELDQMGDDGAEIQRELLKMTGQRSVPNVFVKQQHIGGNDDTQLAAKEGKLQKLLGIK
mmetsp:Transcript_34213/g.38235  ORF Transcript_34213/g.38235 Transcript_34213/m.38235 type:complete len:174 (+) Transcript_34213:105-626(+)